MPSKLIKADWTAPPNVLAMVSTRDSVVDSQQQRGPVQWVQQIHGANVFSLENFNENIKPQADAIYTRQTGILCGIHTADCLPVFFCDKQGQEIAIAHAGWRGLAAGVLENTLSCFQAEQSQLLAWFGPAIGSCHFEVGEEVRDIFLQAAGSDSRADIAAAFTPASEKGKWMADLYALARKRLNAAGLVNISGGGLCTYCDSERFYSYRRAKETGRMDSLICIS